jgi:hypothetical protein
MAPAKEPMLMMRPCFLWKKRRSSLFTPLLARKRLENEPFDHAGKDCVGDIDGAVDIDLDDVVNFVFGRFRKIYGHRVRLANVVD